MRPPCPSSVRPSVEPRCCSERFVTQELPDHLVGTRIRVQMDFRSQMPELMWRDLYADVPQYGALDCYPYGAIRCRVCTSPETRIAAVTR
jgi:hypothetical protein